MNLEQIKAAIEQGIKVYWASLSYEVIKTASGEYLIKNGSHCIGLFWEDGDVVKLNGKESDFFTKSNF